jgi:DNA (cytosine-5)-methyltransferase 1
MSRPAPRLFYEFFAGGGMARAGLGEGWRCLFANDFDPRKASAYRANWGGDHLAIGDVHALAAADLPGRADLAWASSPCQDFSLAGARAGLAGGRSSAFWGFWRLIEGVDDEGRAPSILVLENVGGLLSANRGADFTAVAEALAGRGYRFGAVALDAADFLPQSRPRVFVIATRLSTEGLTRTGPAPTDGPGVAAAYARLPAALQARWLWWRLAPPPTRNTRLADLLEPDDAVVWRGEAQTAALLAQLSPAHCARLTLAGADGRRVVAAVFRRIRIEAGRKVQRAELRLDGLAGCLRTPGGGSSRQMLLVAEAGRVRSRLITPREGARLMGLADDYRLPAVKTAALHLVGDGVAVPVVRYLAQQVLEPLLASTDAERASTNSERTAAA